MCRLKSPTSTNMLEVDISLSIRISNSSRNILDVAVCFYFAGSISSWTLSIGFSNFQWGVLIPKSPVATGYATERKKQE